MIKSTASFAVAAALTVTASVVQAAGFQLNEYSAAGMGRSFAGAGVVADDFSAIGFNPAGMSLNKTSGMQAGASVVSLYSDFSGTVDSRNVSGTTRITRVLPSGFAQYKTGDLTLGLGVYVPFGLATDYENGWLGEDHGGLSQVTMLNISPAVSYAFSDMFSIGAALNIQHAKARLTSASGTTAKDLKGDDWGLGYTIGATITPVKGTRLGVSYRSKVSHQLKGKIKISGAPLAILNGKNDITAKVTSPEVVLFSLAQDVTPKLTLSATARYTRWSRFKDLDIKTADNNMRAYSAEYGLTNIPAGTNISSTHENWKNTWFYALGADYKATDTLTLRLGAAYDQTVIRADEYRTVRIPDGRRIWASFGLSYEKGPWVFDAAYAHIFVKTAHAKGGETGKAAPDIKYDSDANMASLGVQYRF